MTGILLIFAAGYIYMVIHVLISVAALVATGHGVGRVQLGAPAWRVAIVRGAELRLGPLPFTAYVVPPTTTQIARAEPVIWDDPEAQRIADQAAERPPIAVLPARLAGIAAGAITFALGVLLYGSWPPLGSFLVTAFTRPMWPWSSGGPVLRQGLTELAALPTGAAIGSALTRWMALVAVSTPLSLAERLPRLWKVANVLQVLLALWLCSWFLSVPIALW